MTVSTVFTALSLAAVLLPCRAAVVQHWEPIDPREAGGKCPVKLFRMQQGSDIDQASDIDDVADMQLGFIREEDMGLILEHAKKLRRLGNTPGRLIHRSRHDQSGASVLNSLNAKALAHLYGMEYLGTYPLNEVRKQETLDLMDLLGLPVPLTDLPEETLTVTSLPEFFAALENNTAPTIYIDYLNIAHADRFSKKFSLNTESFRNALKMNAHFEPATLWSKKAKLRVAVHIRRGGVMSGMMMNRLVPNSYYLGVMDEIAKVVPGAEFIIFSSTPFSCNMPGYQLKEFDARSDVMLRLDGSLPEAWSHFVAADVFVKSHSSFSQVPGLYNEGVIIDPSIRGARDKPLATGGTTKIVQTAAWQKTLKQRLQKFIHL